MVVPTVSGATQNLMGLKLGAGLTVIRGEWRMSSGSRLSMMQMTTLWEAAKDECEFGNSLKGVSKKKKKMLEKKPTIERRAVTTTGPLLLASSLPVSSPCARHSATSTLDILLLVISTTTSWNISFYFSMKNDGSQNLCHLSKTT